MYDYQSQTSLPPIRARQQRPSGVQVQQLYESSPVLAAISHHPSNTHYTSHKLQHAESSTIPNVNSTTVNTTNATTNGYHSHHHHNSTSQIPNNQQTSDQSLRKSPSVDSMLSIHSSSQQRRTNALEPDAAMKTYMSKLTAYERHEIFSYPQIYFVGQNARKRQGVGGGPNNGKKIK
jgi:dual specificity tyrosine-phosphorylation-regulated kinase 2/3/4